jgi:sigma-B regulation protein RsbU (phosphoserine phosphatase)
LSLKIFQLRNLFDISRELTTTFEEEEIRGLVTTTLMGHLMASRCLFLTREPGGGFRAYERGLRVASLPVQLSPEEGTVVEGLSPAIQAVAALPPGSLRERLLGTSLRLLVPLPTGGRIEGLFALGDLPAGRSFDAEDHDFAMTLGRQALAALENVRLQQLRIQKLRQDRELQIAREIQQSLFPAGRPTIPGFQLAAQSEPSQQVGGDLFDFIPLPGGRIALAVADVSGKGTPASILMASLHASLRALAGTSSPARLMERLNDFILATTQENKYVTLFYGELDPELRRLSYVSAGHVPPFLVRADGRSERLDKGGPVLGLLRDVAFEVGEIGLASGDLLAVVTDGATEAASSDDEDEEFGDGRVLDALAAAGGCEATEVLARLLAAVRDWAGPAGCADDLTALVLRAL